MRQLLRAVRRWWPDRPIVAVADSTHATLEFLAACRSWRKPIAVVTRLRLDAALYEPAQPRRPGQTGRPRRKGRRLPTLAALAADPAPAWTGLTVATWSGAGERTVEVASDTAVWYHGGLPLVTPRWVLVRDPQGKFDVQALPCTDPTADPAQILAWFVLRWQLEVTFEEARRHLGVETQRQWSDLAILPTTPAPPGLFSVVTVLAHPHATSPGGIVRRTGWYAKVAPTSSDALALARREVWAARGSCTSSPPAEVIKVSRPPFDHLTDSLRYAA